MRRIVLYSHDTLGLGHLRRNLLIARQLASSLEPTAILLITGTSQVSAFALPPGVDCLSLPSVCKKDDGSYDSRRLSISTASLIALRSKMIRAAVEEFDPDVLIVDKVPRGVLGELDPTLRWLRSVGHTRCVLGLRDVLDDPAAVRTEWLNEANNDAIEGLYDAVWVYGDPNVYDVVQEYGLPDAVVDKLHYTGYLNPRLRSQADVADGNCDAPLRAAAMRRLVVCLVGGGEDGARLAGAFANAELPEDTEGVIVAGPFMPPDSYKSLCHAAAKMPHMRVLRFVDEPDRLVRCADRVIAMAGYNTICEILCHRKPSLVVPRVKPRREQWIRACRLQRIGLLDVLHPDQLTPGRLADWITRDRQPPPDPSLIDFGGLERVSGLLDSLSLSSDASGTHKLMGSPVTPPHPRRAAPVWSCDEDSVPLC